MTAAINFEALQRAARDDLSLLNAQLATNQPQPSGVFSIVSDPLLPDRNIVDRLGHFDPELYDLRDTSNLMKIITALLGGSGVGGLRKQTAVARLNNAFATTHFLDLDRFYGALFGIVRTNAEMMPDFGTLTDDSGTLVQAQDTSVTYTLHRDSDFALASTVTTANPYTMGEEFEVVSPISVSALRYWRAGTGYVATAMAIMDQKTGLVVDRTLVTPTGPPATAPAWHTTTLPSAVVLGPGRYVVAGYFPAGYCYRDSFFLPTGLMPTSTTVGPVKFLTQADATDARQPSFVSDTALSYPRLGGPGGSYGVDLVFTAAADQAVSGGRQFDPYTDAAGNDVWDDVHSRDAGYRARLIKFAKALPQGGTYPGLLAAAEAILSVDCQLYESWSWVDDAADHGGVVQATGYTWGSD